MTSRKTEREHDGHEEGEVGGGGVEERHWAYECGDYAHMSPTMIHRTAQFGGAFENRVGWTINLTRCREGHSETVIF